MKRPCERPLTTMEDHQTLNSGYNWMKKETRKVMEHYKGPARKGRSEGNKPGRRRETRVFWNKKGCMSGAFQNGSQQRREKAQIEGICFWKEFSVLSWTFHNLQVRTSKLIEECTVYFQSVQNDMRDAESDWKPLLHGRRAMVGGWSTLPLSGW